MCKIDMPASRTAAKPPPAPMQVAGNLKTQERPDSPDGTVKDSSTARGRATLRNPAMGKKPQVGVNAPQMGA